MMWSMWTLVGLTQIITGRYLKHAYKWRQLIHSMTGTLLLITTLSAWIIVLKLANWKLLLKDFHTITGNITMLAGILVCLGGLFAGSLRIFAKMEWKTSLLLLFGKIHKIFGYSIVVLSQITVSSGIQYNLEFEGQLKLSKVLISCNVIGFILVISIFEFLHQIKLR